MLDYAPRPKNNVEKPRHPYDPDREFNEKIGVFFEQHKTGSILAIVAFIALAVEGLIYNMNPDPESPYDGVIIDEPGLSTLYQCTKEKFSEIAVKDSNKLWMLQNCGKNIQQIIDSAIAKDPQDPLKQLTILRDKILTAAGIPPGSVTWIQHRHGSSAPPTASFRHHGNGQPLKPLKADKRPPRRVAYHH